MTSSRVVKASVSAVIINSPSQDYTHLNDHNLPAYDMTPSLGTQTYFRLSPLSTEEATVGNTSAFVGCMTSALKPFIVLCQIRPSYC